MPVVFQKLTSACGPAKGLNTSKKHPKHLIYPYLLSKLPVMRRTHVWCSDFTYIPVHLGLIYLVAVVGWAKSKMLA